MSRNHHSDISIYICVCVCVCVCVTGFEKICLNAANNFFQYLRVKPYGSVFFQKKMFMAEMDKHLLALSYSVIVSSGDMAIPNLFWRSVEVVSVPPPLYLNFYHKLAMIAKPSIERWLTCTGISIYA